MNKFVTNIPWETDVKGTKYGQEESYIEAAKWLEPCASVADWGGGRGHFQRFLPPTTRYQVVDGTEQVPDQIVADLSTYREPSEGILLRHVLEMTPDWKDVLTNAIEAFQKRLVIVTFTKSVRSTKQWRHHLAWPVYRFNHAEDLIPSMRPYLVAEPICFPHRLFPETVYLLEKP